MSQYTLATQSTETCITKYFTEATTAYYVYFQFLGDPYSSK